MRKYYCLFIVCCFAQQLNAQPYAEWNSHELKLNNGLVQRIIKLPDTTASFITTVYKPATGNFNYFVKTNTDFQFEADGKIYSGKTNWILQKITTHADNKQGNGAAVQLISDDKKIELTVQFLLYPNLALVRKNLIIKNLSEKAIMLQSVDVEKFETIPYWAATFSWILHDYGRRRSIGPYNGNMQDALVAIHNSDWQQGLVIGNEASGVLKHTSVFWKELGIASGLTHKNDRFPFRKYINSNESFTTPQVFTIVYNNHKDPDEVLNTVVPDFVRRHLGIRLSELEQKPTFVYNTWMPFEKNINEILLIDLARNAAKAGVKEFVIDDGWQDEYGDWGINSKKFPNGLKPLIDSIKAFGMKPGIWVSIGTASPFSKIYKQHPEWFVADKYGKPTSLLTDDADKYTACFSTPWYNYIKAVLQKLIDDYELEYMKLDFSVVTSPYRFNPEESGCYATNHSAHKDHNESFYVNYEAMWKLLDELHIKTPELFIDCTFETMGGLQLIDYAMLKHAEGNWLSNFSGTETTTDLRIRNMAWWRSPTMPATALVIGNAQMQDKGWELHLKSLAGALPIMLGDPGKLSAIELNKYKLYSTWLALMEKKYQIMSYRQDLFGFGEPKEGMWDGFQRINTDTREGGIIGVFKQDAAESIRMVTINYLDSAKTYKVRTMGGKTVINATGKVLQTKGFEVNLKKKYDGILYEVVAH